MDGLVPFVPPSRPVNLVWEDDFNGAAGSAPDSTKWHIEPGPPAGSALQYFKATNVELDGESHLAITARKETFEGKEYTSGRVQTKAYGAAGPLFSFLYGRLEARIKVPSGKGLWPVFFTLGASESEGVKWPNNGEIDILEMHLGEPAVNKPNLHGGPQEGSWAAMTTVFSSWVGAANFSEGFHNYGVIWSPNQIEYTIDGATCARRSQWSKPGGQTWPFSAPQFIVLEMAVGGAAGEPNVETLFPSTMLVDWIRIYQ